MSGDFAQALENWLNPPDEPPPQRHANGHTYNGDASKWAQQALNSEIGAIFAAANGTRNDRLNKSAFNIGQIIAGGHLDETEAVAALTHVALAAGLEPAETRNTIQSGIASGKKQPRHPKETPWPPATPPTFATDTGTPGAAASATGAAPEGQGGAPETNTDLNEIVRANLPILDWHALWADQSEEEWIVEPILPARRLVAIYSPPKIGKSLLMLEIAAAIASGRMILGVTPDRPRRVLYVDFENDPKADIRERLQAMGYKPEQLERLCYLSFPTLAALDSATGGRELLAAVQVYECEVVVIDTVSRAVAGEENENDTWLAFYRHTGLLLKQAGVALVRLDHTGKDETKGQRGGSAKSGDVDAVWRLSTVVADETYRLDNDMARMPVAEKTLTLHRRQLPHLHHQVDPRGRAAAEDAATKKVVELLDFLDVDPDLGRDKVREVIKKSGRSAPRNASLSRAIKVRKDRKNLSHDLGDRSGTADHLSRWGQVGDRWSE